MSSNIAVNHSNSSKINATNVCGNSLTWALICSILLHALLAFIIPNIKFDIVKKPELLVVELRKITLPPPVKLPEPVKAETKPVKPKTEPNPKLKSITKPLPLPDVVKTEPMTDVQTPEITSSHTEVIAITPKTDAAIPSIHPAPIVANETPKPAITSQEDIDVARGKYGNTLWSEIGKHKQYPRIAQMRGWQGEAIVELMLDGNGKLKSKKIIQSSGFDILDKQALDMVEKAAPFPAPPEALHNSIFSIKVPIPFKLE